MRWKVSRYNTARYGGKKLGEEIVHANTIEQACLLFNHQLCETNKAIIRTIARFFGNAESTIFIKDYENTLPENKRQFIYIEQISN